MTPKCLAHHVWHASCANCTAQREAERAAARRRLAQS